MTYAARSAERRAVAVGAAFGRWFGLASVVASVFCVISLALARRAEAYPQYQLRRDATCGACHLSPAGGGLLTENGLAVAEQSSQLGTAPEVMYGALPLPGWLELGGDLRAAAGYMKRPDGALAAFPMQADVHTRARAGAFALHATAGLRPAPWVTGNGTPALADRFWSREHYLMWQPADGAAAGLYARAGRFMPVFGLRLVEHVDYVRRYGGTPLYGETYAASVGYVSPRWEAHATGFIADPLIDSVLADDGAAGYAEVRLSDELAIGGEAMLAATAGRTTLRGGATAKLYLPAADLVVQGELQLAHLWVDGGRGPNQLTGYVLASRPIGDAVLIDLGLGHHDEDVAIRGLDRDAVDVNVHWFVTSHVELVWQSRIEGIGVGQRGGGPTSGWSLLHAHYRL